MYKYKLIIFTSPVVRLWLLPEILAFLVEVVQVVVASVLPFYSAEERSLVCYREDLQELSNSPYGCDLLTTWHSGVDLWPQIGSKTKIFKQENQMVGLT